MKIKVSSGFTGVIPTGSYQNARPSYSAEVEYDFIDNDADSAKKIIDAGQKMLQQIAYDNFKADEQKHIVERIEREREDIRFYETPQGKYPSVTSIIGWDADFFLDPRQLQEYASQGNLYDAQVRHYMQTGTWLPAEEIEGTWSDIVIVKKGSLGLTVGGFDFPAFLKKHPVEKMEEGKPVFSHVHKFAGTPDIRVCWYDGKKTLADVKRTPQKSHFKQLAGYIIAEEENGESPYEQMILIPANNKTKQGFSKPVVSTEINQFKKAFLHDREMFKKRFGI